MELKLEVVLSTSIKRKKPWPRFCWLGQEKESVFLLDDKRISEINMVSGRTKKRTPKLHPLLNSVVTMASSRSGVWLCGILVSGELFLWNRDKDLLKTAAAAPEVVQVITSGQGNTPRFSLQVSRDGMRVLLVAITGHVFLWECVDVRDLTGVRDGTVKGRWAHIKPLEDTVLPSLLDKEACQHSIFVKTEAVGDACLSALVFTSGKKLIITCLKIQWEEGNMRVGSVGYSIQWATKTYPMSHLTPTCQPVKSRGAMVPAFSPDGQLLAIVLNQRHPKATQVLYVSTQNFVSVSSSLGGCGMKTLEIPSKYIRSYWVGSVSWSPSSLFLACVLKRGSLLVLARLGGLLSLTSSGCNVDFGPAHFLPLHPLVTYRPPVSAGSVEANMSSSSLSVRDILRQRYSVTWHPRLLYLIVSDGYMATVMRVLDRPSPAMLLKSLLKDTSRDLEKTSLKLEQSKIHVRAWLESVSCLNLDSSLEALSPIVTRGPNAADSVFSGPTGGSTLPLFLQDQGTLSGTKGLFEKVQTFLDDDSDFDGPPAGSHMENVGRLEFASMFDTLHAHDTQTDTLLTTGPDYEKDFAEPERKTPLLHRELGKIRTKLLTAWAFGLSLGNEVEHRACLLKHTLLCVVRFAALVHLISSSTDHTGKKNTSVSTRLLHLIKTLLSFLPWDSAHSNGPCCQGLVVELSKRLIRLLLTPHPESYQTGHCQLSSQLLSTVLHILQLVSDSLDHTYSLQQKTVWSSAKKESVAQSQQLWPSDVYHVPLLQDEKKKKLASLDQGCPVPQRPSSRLFGVWQWVYKVTQKYLEELNNYEGCDGWEEEQQQLTFLMSQIQTALQATGAKLEQGPALMSYPGEHLFLCGLYPKSAEAWRSQICDESNKICDRRVFQEERLCLALLYSLLSQYRLREAQELGDHMARLILHRAGHQKDNRKSKTDSFPCTWLPVDLHSDAAFAVVQSLGRVMASYFANQPLHILPPHNVAVLPPLHLPHGPSVGRLVPLCQEEVATAVRRQHLSEVWTVDYAQDLLLLGGLLPEAVWLASHLGDWKTAVSLSLAYTSYCTDHCDFARLRRRELHLPTDMEAESIFQAELESLLGNKPDSQGHRDKEYDKSLTDPLEGEDWDLLLVSMQEILRASVMAGVNVMSSPLSSLLDTAKDLCSCLPLLVPSGLYLPSPPLYCPQPSPNTQDPIGTVGQFAEVASRHKVSAVLQRLLLLLRSARCCQPAAQWYITHLRRARHLLHKIKKKYSYPAATEEEKAFPEGLMKFVTRSGFFRLGPNKDGHLDSDTIQTIICFRELCGLCWMLHVRDQLSISCRKYQAARQHCRDKQIPGDSDVRSSCAEALRWARRFLPFSRYLNAEEILQDVLLSLVSELPPVSLVADTLVQAFPGEEESVRVPLREKYNSLLQRLRQCNVLEGERDEANELMMVLIQDKHRQRRKHLGRLRRHLAPPELHLWEKEEEEEDRGNKHGMAMMRQLSLGTSLSTSTLTDCGFPPVCSDGDTAENTSEAISPEQHCRAMSRDKKVHKVRDRENAVKIESAIQEETHPDGTKGNEKSPLPVVGTWEFELEDEEYLNFLELFISYELEKDGADGGDPGSELPLLKSFSSKLRERELHSLTFDVLTTIHRRQRDGHHPGRKPWSSDPPVFRAGCCYKPIKQGPTPEPQSSAVWNEASISRASLSVSSLPGPRTGKMKGLFGLRKQSSVHLAQRKNRGHCGSESSPIKSTFPIGQPSESLMFASPTSVEAVTELQQGLVPKLEAQFPELGRLLEWMVRWADRRVLLHHRRKKKERGGGVGGPADEGVVIRVKASAPAVLTSLSLLEWRYTALFGTERYSTHIQVPETQWTVAPVVQPAVDGNPERESSIDTGYPGSANTPITGPDHNLQQGELSISSCTDEPEELTRHRKPLSNDQDQQTFHAQRAQSSSQQPYLDDLDFASEKEGKSSGSERLEMSSLEICENICTLETSLKLADLDSENTEDTFTSTSLSVQAPLHPEPQALPPVQPKASVHTDVTDTVGGLFPDTPVDPPNLQPQSSMAGAPTPVSAAPDQPLSNQPPQMRQRLGEDLFRLVQNINYMSMMEVLGASFSSLELAQQNSSLAQSSMNSSHPNVPSSHVTNFIPQPNVLPVQTSVSVAPQTQASGAGVNDQEMHPLSVLVGSPEIQFKQSRSLILSSKGLLVTADIRQAVPSTPVALPSNVSLQNDPAPQVLKLLQARCPPLHQERAPHYPPAQESQTRHTENPAFLESHQPQRKHSYQAASERAEEKRTGSSVLRRQLSFNNSQDPPPCSSEPRIQMSEGSRGQEFPLLPPAFPAQTPARMQDPRLLHLQPSAPSNITFPKLPMPVLSRPSTVMSAPMGGIPVTKLLHIQPGPKMMSPMAAPSTQMTSLISREDLTSSVIRRQNVEEVQQRLLRVDPPNESTRAAPTSPSSNSSKRQRRREEKTCGERKTAVTFKPNESIIPMQTPADEPVKPVIEEPAVSEITPGHSFAIPLGSFDSLLTGQTLLDKAESTSAELHAFASTCKKPPECHDAFTNTEPACPPTLVDKSVSASVTTSSPESQGSQNLHLVQNIEENRKKPERVQVRYQMWRLTQPCTDVHRHQFISVLDLEDNALHHDLPWCLSPGTQDVPSVRPSSPTSAQLHVLATSVIRSHAAAAAASDPQPSITITDNLLKPNTHPDTPEDSQLHSHESSPERVTLQDMADPSDSQICQAIKTLSVGPHRASFSPPTVLFSSRLSELDAQVASLQRIADNLEMDFSNSRMLVSTIENLTPGFGPNMKSPGAVKKNVRLSVPKEAWTPRLEVLTEPNAYEEEEERQDDQYVHHSDSFRHFTPSHSQRAGPSYAHTPRKVKDPSPEASGISHVWEEENLGQTGLSDTAEMLEELVREGYLSRTDLDLSTSQPAHHSSRPERRDNSWVSPSSVFPDDERRELRIWMKGKQRERLAVYQKHRESLRERELDPFPVPGKVKSTNRNQVTVWRTRQEKEKFMLMEQYNQRTLEACSLARGFPASPPVLRSSSQPEGPPLPAPSQSTSAPLFGSTHRVYRTSSNDKRNLKSPSGPSQPLARPWTAEGQGRPTGDHSRRLGLHRPVTSLPRDRLSQVTRRGMVTDTKSHMKRHTANQIEDHQVGYERKMQFNKRPSGGTAFGRGIQREQMKTEDEEMKRREESNTVLTRLSDEQDDGAAAGASEMDWLDNLSDSAGSCLSKIDWAAIERMVAADGD
ncbi:ciliogenesis and planar polarity effector 1 [Hippoglossus hippoglossus]|uniref:ciliogenesis and planar polarity effector 1 n=1 Tax=Hippoglossus hippoglossus TaxID=8267 RepID=UPI00148C8180|nr:ciliogenesis and planar polarity effector 1 [Hippoglossus hippoglossus]